MKLYLAVLLLCGTVHGLNNGLALTPPMGFLSWERFRCNIDCKDDPDNCISERLYRSIADAIVSGGYKDLGYEYVNIDDCWLAHTRDKMGRLQPDPDRFPSGIKNLSQYMHDRGLKLGIYEDFGSYTCAGYPGSEFFLKTDADTFASWEIDLLKFDGCNSDPDDMSTGYPVMMKFLNLTGRPILYSCEWPLYKKKANYEAIRDTCNIWRNFNDIQDSWGSVLSIINYYGKDEGNFSAVTGPGGFNDPDEIIVGDFGLSKDQQRIQFGMWALFSAPLFVSADLRKIDPASKAILQNKRVIAINQDPLGKQATLLYSVNTLQVWRKPLAANGTFAFGLLNTSTEGMPTNVQLTLAQLELSNPAGYNITEVFDDIFIGSFKQGQTFNIKVDPTGMFLGKAVPLS